MTDYNAIAAALLASQDWRSNMDAPGGIPTGGPRPAPTLSQGPAPTGYDKVFDAAYGALGGTPDKRRLAETLTQGFDLATLGMATGAYDGGRHFAATGEPALLAATMMPGARVPGAAAKMAEKAAERGIRAFHGSPHDFDKFDLSKIGTGEGNQAYGHGLYFAEREGVAKSYRDGLTRTYKIDDGKFVPRSDVERDFKYMLDLNGGDLDKMISNLSSYRGMPEDSSKRYVRALDFAEKIKSEGRHVKDSGRMYEVKIKADHEHFLDWDKPLSQQSPAIRDKAIEAVQRANARLPSDLKAAIPEWDVGAAATSVEMPFLREAGIPGIKYLDQGSRTAGEGSRNYVVFDDSIIEILRKYGLLPPAAAGGYAAAQSSPAEATP